MGLAAGGRVGAYEIVGLLGAGGMGEVYRARDTRLQRDVAIKILPELFALDTERRARFEREAQVLASLNHPHIAAIYGFEDTNSTGAIVMELVEGPTLADRITRESFPVADALAVAKQIAMALEAAHEKGIIHRDLKPANIKLTPDGTIKVLDFGLAKAVAGDAPQANLTQSPTLSAVGTRAGVILGTAAYMSPEQARGHAIDKRTDIWAFGCILYELLTRSKAFAGATVSDVVAAILRSEPDWPALPVETPPSIRTLLRRCLQRDVKRRLRDIGDARIEIEDALAGETTSAERPETSRRERIAWMVAATALVAFVSAVALMGGPPRSQVSAAPSISRVVRLTTGPALENGPAIAPDGKWVAYLSNARGATDVWVKFIAGGEPANLTASANLELQSQSDIGGVAISPDGASIAFDAGVREIGPPSFSSWVIPAPLGGVPRRLVANGRAVRWSPDGKKIVYVVSGGSAGDAVWVADADGSNPREIAPRRIGIHKHWAAWSHDARYVYFNHSIVTGNTEPAEIYRVPASGGPIEPFIQSARRAVFPALSPDGNGLVYAANPTSADLSLWWKSLTGEDAAHRLTTGIGEYAEPSIAADGRSLVSTVIDVRQSLVRLAVSAGGNADRAVSITDGYTGDLDPAMSPSGDRLVFASTRSGNRNLWVARPDGREARPLTSGTAIDEHPCFSPDGAQIAFVSDRGGARGIWVMNADGGAARSLVAAPVLDTISWSPDGRDIVFAVPGESGLSVARVSDGAVRALKTPGPAATPAWSPHGDAIAYIENRPGGPKNAIALRIAFVTPDGEPAYTHVPPISTVGNGGLAWAPDGKRLAAFGNSGVMASVIWIIDLEAATPLRRLTEFPADVRLRGITWSRDGSSVFVGQQRKSSDIVLFELAVAKQ